MTVTCPKCGLVKRVQEKLQVKEGDLIVFAEDTLDIVLLRISRMK